VANLQKSECIFFAKILFILGNSSESNRWIWVRVVKDKAKVFGNPAKKIL